jgi:putative aldouronate transport system permease protein
MGTATSLLLTLFAAYALSRDYLPGKKIFSGLILFTMYFSGGMIPTFLVVKGLGMYNTLGALFVPQAVNVFNFIVMRTFFRELPKSLEEAAKIDGASEMQVMTRVVLPLSMPIMATMALFYAVGYWNSYFEALLYIQDPDKYTLQLRLRSLLFGEELNTSGRSLEGVGTEVMSQSLKMATVAVSTIPILVVYPWLQKYFVKGVMLGSIKG